MLFSKKSARLGRRGCVSVSCVVRVVRLANGAHAQLLLQLGHERRLLRCRHDTQVNRLRLRRRRGGGRGCGLGLSWCRCCGCGCRCSLGLLLLPGGVAFWDRWLPQPDFVVFLCRRQLQQSGLAGLAFDFLRRAYLDE